MILPVWDKVEGDLVALQACWRELVTRQGGNDAQAVSDIDQVTTSWRNELRTYGIDVRDEATVFILFVGFVRGRLITDHVAQRAGLNETQRAAIAGCVNNAGMTLAQLAKAVRR